MREFAAIRLDLDALADAAVYSANVDYTMDGELRRRGGMAIAQEQSGNAIASFRSVTAGPRVLFATSAGTIVELAAT